MSKATITMVILNCMLIALLLVQQANKLEPKTQAATHGMPSPTEYCGTNATATTLNSASTITGNSTFAQTGLTLSVTKLQDNSALFYTCQITFQFDTSSAVGAHFKMRVKDSNNNYIMPDMVTGEVSNWASAYENAMLSDTVIHTGNSGDPPAGTYTFELWALAGGGNLTIVPYMSNIAVLELPRPHPCD